MMIIIAIIDTYDRTYAGELFIIAKYPKERIWPSIRDWLNKF